MKSEIYWSAGLVPVAEVVDVGLVSVLPIRNTHRRINIMVATKTRPRPNKVTEVKAKGKGTKVAVKHSTKGKAATTKTNTKKSTPAAKTAEKASTPREPRTRELNVFGFTPGSDSAVIVETMVAGGEDRNDINAKSRDAIEATNGIETRNGGEKNVPSLVSGLLNRLVNEEGYTVESTWRLVPPAEVQAALKKQQASEKRKVTRKASAKK